MLSTFLKSVVFLRGLEINQSMISNFVEERFLSKWWILLEDNSLTNSIREENTSTIEEGIHFILL